MVLGHLLALRMREKGPDPPPVIGNPSAIRNNDDLSTTGTLACTKQLNFCFKEDTHIGVIRAWVSFVLTISWLHSSL